MARKRERGFMILELLIVIVIIAILASLTVVRYLNVRDKSRIAAATYDLDCVRKFLAYYSTDYDGFPPAAATYDDLKNQMVDPRGNPYGRLPLSNTYTWISYALNPDGTYRVRIQVVDRNHTVLVATPDGVHPE
ncbi:MAG TPA: prepilin-type N-terminal cleavage/methylation domain-containing protein [bacterium]|jgi:prepilin-type N-terminal cleavage/methylation domain-containing protein